MLLISTPLITACSWGAGQCCSCAVFGGKLFFVVVEIIKKMRMNTEKQDRCIKNIAGSGIQQAGATLASKPGLTWQECGLYCQVNPISTGKDRVI